MLKQPAGIKKMSKDAVASPLRQPKIGLALGAGVARGWAHIGIIRSMLAAGIVPEVIAGTSIGAVVGGAYANCKLDDVESWARSLSRTNFFRFLDFRIGGGGLFGGQKLAHIITESFGDVNIESLPFPFAAVACELATGHEIWLQSGRMTEAVQASFALPGVFEPVHLGGRWLVDGALVNPVPVSVCRALGAELVIAVNLAEDIYGRARASRQGQMATEKYGIFGDTENGGRPDEKRAKKTIMRQLFGHEKDAPSLFANMVGSLNIMQNRLSRSRLAGDPPDVLIAPRCGHVGLMEFHRADELIDVGTEAFDTALPFLTDALSIIGYQMNNGF